MTTGLAVPNDAIAAPGVTTTLTEILSDELILTGSTGAVGRALGHDFHTTVRLVLRLRRSPRLSENWTHRPTWCCHGRRLGLVTYHSGRLSVDRSDSPRSRPVPDAAASVCWISRAKGSGVTAMESTC
jgi:hypothetical protein